MQSDHSMEGLSARYALIVLLIFKEEVMWSQGCKYFLRSKAKTPRLGGFSIDQPYKRPIRGFL